ncbi:alanine--tRNA ligase [Parachlamydia sp. AcF125]|uniref:alanine--tRNA ligase n=1 Tax=Parachlamydia sp. AcF125 TaxID=2795736 RepID=UPI001BCA1A5C|nr:alanine--tRNA ligase [Parachlamydia sp. AcF125]MBS4167955.1 Alanine--tRNA ligase [Parachlamydia sp. AcF125]
METQRIRRQFLNYFKEHGHRVISSSPVFPHDDPTLLFTNAGMNQFKDVFLGKSARDYQRATTSQKCIRVGGKHNDLENVGHTSRHLTFFEMLGNFSFGDYFKAEAIQFAWDISTQVFGFDPQSIWPTVFRDDEEAFELWTRYVPANKITRFGEKDNFWSMGEVGPCGPCSELYYDRGPKYGPANNPSEDVTGERYLEFWNLVFMQFNRLEDGSLSPLPKPSIDTGAGIERVVGLKMDVDSVFGTDVLRELIAQTEQVFNKTYEPHNKQTAPAFHVIADHLRCLAFAIADGVQPSNVDRGYVLRKVLRRAVRYGRSLGMDTPFLAHILPRLVATMGEDYKELVQGQQRIAEILTVEEEAFLRTLRRGGNILNQIIESAQHMHQRISGDDAFKLKDTYGFPLEEIELIARDANLGIDKERFEVLENEAKERSRQVQKTTQQIASPNIFVDFIKANAGTAFLGYQQLTSKGTVTGLVVNDQFVDQIIAGQEAMIILNQTPFYAEMGGQVGDTGTLLNSHGVFFQVANTISPYQGVIAHVGTLVQGHLKVGDLIEASVNSPRRQKIENNHTATHLLHWALHHVLGEHVKQAGSVVEPGRLRFDFSHHKPLTKQEVQEIENLVNQRIRQNLPVKTYEIAYDEAQKCTNIKQFFGEKYGAKVRVVDADFSKELCGGTHTSALGNIGLFRIAKESSIAAGVRRIEAVTGEEAESFARHSEQFVDSLAELLKTQPQKLQERIEKLLEENKQLAQEIKNLKKGKMEEMLTELVRQVEMIRHIPAIIAKVDISPAELRNFLELLQAKMGSGTLALAVAEGDKCHLIIRVSDDLVTKGIHASQLIKTLAPIIEGTGGGKPNIAQAGGKAPHKIAEALTKFRELLQAL